MSYYAYCSGEIELKEDENIILEKLKQKYQEYEDYTRLDVFILNKFNINSDNFYNETIGKHIMMFYSDEKYDEDLYIEMLESLAEYVVQPATIEFRGEDDCCWKLVLKDNEVSKYSGSIVYDDEKESPMHVTLDDVKKFIQEKKFKDYIGTYKNANAVFDKLYPELEKVEDYWDSTELKRLSFAIALANHAWYNEENYDNDSTLDVLFSEASDYIDDLLTRQQL